MKQRYVLVVDDEPHMRRVLEIMLRQAGHAVFAAGNGREALDVLRANPVDLVITDMRMPEMDGIELLTHMRNDDIDTPVIMITAHGSVESAVDAMKRGASDYILRPFDINVLELAISRVLSGAEVARENTFLREELERGWGEFVGTGAAMQAVYALIRQGAPAKATVMITGETGTGKELVARAIHSASPRAGKLFVPINCAAIPAEILEAELFGYEKGAFTGAVKERIGKFELANGGTLFLDELTEMPMPLQAKLLRVLQEGSIERLGSNRVIPLDVRIVAATNRNPREAIEQGKLREDLYYRVNVFAITLPALRERPEDIPELLTHFIAKHGGQPSAAGLDAQLMTRLQSYAWPGNVRELENVLERAVVLSGGNPIRASHFPQEIIAASAPAERIAAAPEVAESGPLNTAVEALEARMIDAALVKADNNKAKAAAALEISERTLWYKLKKYRGLTD